MLTPEHDKLVHVFLLEHLGGETPPDLTGRVLSRTADAPRTSGHLAASPDGESPPDLTARVLRRTVDVPRRRFRRLILPLTAAAAAIVTAVILWGVLGKKDSQTQAPPIAGNNGSQPPPSTIVKLPPPQNPEKPHIPIEVAHETIRQILSDGSRVTLEKGAQWCKFDRVDLPDERTGVSRRVRLVELTAGRAQFDVAKDADPFIVKTPAYNVQVTGAQFEVDVPQTEEKGKAKMAGNKMITAMVGLLLGTSVSAQAGYRTEVKVAPSTEPHQFVVECKIIDLGRGGKTVSMPKIVVIAGLEGQIKIEDEQKQSGVFCTAIVKETDSGIEATIAVTLKENGEEKLNSSQIVTMKK
ncbi:MAG: FecR domain-containing protein [Planctomycetes bacterium]|nr:FecR domain-containing protein [Planctomycetota bacterium]